MTTALIALLLLAVQAPPTLAEALALPPAEAGDRLLASRPHGQIVELQVLPRRPMDPAGWVEVELREAVQELPNGCQRPSWRVTLSAGPQQNRASSEPSPPFGQQQVALKGAGGCESVRFAEIGGTLSADAALSALAVVQSAVATDTPLQARCRDTTRSGLCRDGTHLRQEIRALSPWVVTNQNGPVEIWLGVRGQTITVVEMSARSDRISEVSRYVPAPF